jgi:hypothetical protein
MAAKHNRYNLEQPNKGKQMKVNESKIAFIYFSESGLFNGLRPIQIKKFRAPCPGCMQDVPADFRISFSSSPAHAELDSILPTGTP